MSNRTPWTWRPAHGEMELDLGQGGSTPSVSGVDWSGHRERASSVHVPDCQWLFSIRDMFRISSGTNLHPVHSGRTDWAQFRGKCVGDCDMVVDVDHAIDPCAHAGAERGENRLRGRIGSSNMLKQGEKPNNLDDH